MWIAMWDCRISHWPPVHIYLCSLEWGEPLDKSSRHWKHSTEFVYTDIRALLLCTQMSAAIPTSLGLFFPPKWVCPVLFKCSNRSQFTHLATTKNEYLCDWDCTRPDRCTPVRVPAATASPFLSQGEALHGTTLQGTAGWGGTVTRPTVQSACNQFEIGQNNNTQEQHSDDACTHFVHCTMCILSSTMALWSKAEIQKYTF